MESIAPSFLFSNFACEMKCNMGRDGDLFMWSKSKVVQVYMATNEPCFFEWSAMGGDAAFTCY